MMISTKKYFISLRSKADKVFLVPALPFCKNYFVITVLLCSSLFLSLQIFATETPPTIKDSFSEWQQEFKQLALKSGVTEKTFELAFDQLKPNQTVLKLDRSQPEFSWAIWRYIDNAIGNKRIEKGKKIRQKHHHLFSEVSKEYNVPAEIIIAIWAMESDFGGNYGNMNIIRSLATLAYDGKRKQFAQTELLAALHILQKEKIQPNEMIGSWAGAMGHPQFMPTSFQKYAVDFNFDGQRDLWHSLDDSFASIANYLLSKGWKEKETWGVEVTFPADFNWQKQAAFNRSNERLTIAEWMLWGIKPTSAQDFQNEDQLAELFFPAGHLGPVFLVFDNFNVIKKYNLSLSYSLAVGLLASEIAKTSEDSPLLIKKWPRKDKLLSRENKIQLQTLLKEKGFNVGKIDGKVGTKTRKAIRQWQLKNTLAADGYLSLQLFEKIQKTISE